MRMIDTDARPARVKPYTVPPDTGLTIAYQDEVLLAVDKPCGLLAVPGRSPDLQDCMANRVRQRFANALVVHRLDEATSGLMLFALNPDAQRLLSRAFEDRLVDKTYIALVQGIMANDQGLIDTPIAADWPRRPLQKLDIANGKPATTHWHVLCRQVEQNATRVELKPLTGRSHQLRVHMLALGHPICGDLLYGDTLPASAALAERLMLHATCMQLMHPVHQQIVRIESAVPF